MDKLEFAYDDVSDGLTIGEVSLGGSFRGITGPLNTGGMLVVEARGGGVFSVTVPHFVAKPKPVAKPFVPAPVVLAHVEPVTGSKP